MQWSWSVIFDNLPKLLDGALLTIELVVFSGLLGLLLAVPIALMRLSSHWSIKALPFAYIYFFRGTPLLIQMFLIYYGLSQFETIKESFLWPVLSSAYWCGIIAFTLNTAAYIAEILRGAISGIPTGEIEAADALGFSQWHKLRRIILPRAFAIMLPAYSNEVIFMLKNSALASTITLLELTGMSRNISFRTYSVLEMFFAAGVIYLLIAWAFLGLFALLERRLSVHKA